MHHRLSLDQWGFHVLSTRTINEHLGAQKSVGLGTLRRLGAVEVGFSDLEDEVARAFGVA